MNVEKLAVSSTRKPCYVNPDLFIFNISLKQTNKHTSNQTVGQAILLGKKYL